MRPSRCNRSPRRDDFSDLISETLRQLRHVTAGGADPEYTARSRWLEGCEGSSNRAASDGRYGWRVNPSRAPKVLGGACASCIRPPLQEPRPESETPIPSVIGTVSQTGSEVGRLVLAADTFLFVVLQDSPVRPEQEIDERDRLRPPQPPDPWKRYRSVRCPSSRCPSIVTLGWASQHTPS